MEKFELVLEVLERGPYGVEAFGLLDGRVVVLVGPEVLHENEPGGPAIFLNGAVLVAFAAVELLDLLGLPQGFDGVEEVSPRNRVDCIAQLVVKVPDFLQDRFDFLQLHVPFHGEKL